MKKFLDSRYGLLAFSLLSGIGYFLLVLGLISGIRYSYLLAWFFLPLIVCGAALCIFKSVRNMQEENQTKKIWAITVFHIILFLFSCVFAYVSYVA